MSNLHGEMLIHNSGLFPFRFRRLRSQLCDPRMGISNTWPNNREESHLFEHRQCRCQCLVHLHAIPVPKIQRTKISHR